MLKPLKPLVRLSASLKKNSSSCPVIVSSFESAKFTPFFLPSGDGSLFCVHYPASGTDKHSTDQAVIYIPAFAEEMNKSRRMISLQAQALAQAGIGSLVIDLYGTGDSSGDFSGARWYFWKKNIEAATDWLRAQGYQRISFVALRLGGLLALDFMGDQKEQFEKLIWWQPVSTGETHLMQFLRLRVASAMFSKGTEDKETTKSLRSRLTAGETIEVAGYDIHPELAIELMEQRAQAYQTLPLNQLDLIELVANVEKAPSPPSVKLVDQWRKVGLNSTAKTLKGDHFWNTQEISTCPELLEWTTAKFK